MIRFDSDKIIQRFNGGGDRDGVAIEVLIQSRIFLSSSKPSEYFFGCANQRE
jgi:hypothetical protein